MGKIGNPLRLERRDRRFKSYHPDCNINQLEHEAGLRVKGDRSLFIFTEKFMRYNVILALVVFITNCGEKNMQVAKGDVFWLDLNIRNGQSVYAVPIAFGYPADRLEVQVGVDGQPVTAIGGFLGAASSLVVRFANNQPGRLVIGYTKQGDEPESAGDGLLCSIRFKALAEGSLALPFDGGTKVLNKMLQPVECTKVDATLEITAAMPAEVNVIFMTVRK